MNQTLEEASQNGGYLDQDQFLMSDPEPQELDIVALATKCFGKASGVVLELPPRSSKRDASVLF